MLLFKVSMNYKQIYNFLSWNVRGLNERTKRLAVRQTIILENPDVVVLQETKLQHISDQIAREICGYRLDAYRVLESIGTRGGIILAVQSRKFSILQTEIGQHFVSVLLQSNGDAKKIWFTGVYGPSTGSN